MKAHEYWTKRGDDMSLILSEQNPEIGGMAICCNCQEVIEQDISCPVDSVDAKDAVLEFKAAFQAYLEVHCWDAPGDEQPTVRYVGNFQDWNGGKYHGKSITHWMLFKRFENPSFDPEYCDSPDDEYDNNQEPFYFWEYTPDEVVPEDLETLLDKAREVADKAAWAILNRE